jgi:uncharacterized protein YegJ (DUF2314 family)
MREIKIGTSVKLNFQNTEKIWVEVKEISGKTLKGKIDQHPRILENIFFGDEIEFNSDNIIDQLVD